MDAIGVVGKATTLKSAAAGPLIVTNAGSVKFRLPAPVFEIVKVDASDGKPHGLDYSFTLHGPDNRRLIGFDNAHRVLAKGARFKNRSKAMDHWHRTETDKGRPYAFEDAETLLDDFFDEVERVLTERGIPFEVVEVKEGDSP